MARFWVLFAVLLLATGSVVKAQEAQDPDGSTDPDTTTSSTTSTTTTATTTTPDPTTTTTPDPTTTTTETTTTTTTTTEKTTTTTPETTTTETTTTTAPPTTTTEKPKPDPHIKYSITENNVTCVMVAGEIHFNVNYTIDHGNSTVVKNVFVPSVASVNGSCNASDGQYISFTWDNNTVQMNFETADKDSWTFTDITASLYIDDSNATDYGKTLDLTVDYNLSPGEVSVNHSFICRSTITTDNVTAHIGKDEYNAPVTSTLRNIQVQAYNKIKNENDFVQSVHCTADNTSDVVPIAVGCALAGLVVIVLIAYLVGRRKRSGAYQSV